MEQEQERVRCWSGRRLREGYWSSWRSMWHPCKKQPCNIEPISLEERGQGVGGVGCPLSHPAEELNRTTGGGHCQVQSKSNGVIPPNHWTPLPRMLCTAKSDMVSKSYQRNWPKKTTLRMTDYKDNDSREDLLC